MRREAQKRAYGPLCLARSKLPLDLHRLIQVVPRNLDQQLHACCSTGPEPFQTGTHMTWTSPPRVTEAVERIKGVFREIPSVYCIIGRSGSACM
jgi:hypothetical protein